MSRSIFTNVRHIHKYHRLAQKVVRQFSSKENLGQSNVVELNKETLAKLERVSGLQFKNQKEIDDLREEIQLANQIFEVDTKDIEPLYSIVEELIDCPLRKDEPLAPDQSRIFENAAEHVEGFFVSPPANVKIDESEAIKNMK